MAKKKIKIDKSLCIGCGCCAGTYPDDIKIGDDGLAETINGVADEDAVGVCPVGAISVEE
ncbi:MAG TPA: ferredoxin [Bacilli bacterium]|nr:ferredoxin [Bacilli bacterium]HPS18589.1 ferredoxin [Bacilli bacterium]